MDEPTPVGNPIYSLLPTEVEGLGPLAELALDMRWSWNHYSDDVWRQLDPALWELTQNPWVVLQTVSRDRRQHVLPTTRPARDYTARVIPQRSGVAVPLESARILWQR